MKRFLVRLGIDGYGFNAELFAGANNAHGNLAPVGYKYFLE